ncbi:MAG: hypothetical protein ACRDTB_05800 [Actinophytocola sp.]
MVRRWEAVYREYGSASERVTTAEPGDRAIARHMARASQDVAAVWREMTAASDLPWWMVAALVAAAQAFEQQAKDWTARAKHHGGVNGSTRRPHPQVVRPTGARVMESDPGAWTQ